MSQTQEPAIAAPAATRWKRYPAYKPSGIDWLGEIPVHWETRRLKYVARFAYGDALASEAREEGQIAVYGSNGIVGTHSIANTKAPCLIVGRKGSYGKVTYTEKPCFAIDTTFFIDPTQTVHYLRWLYYVLLCLRLDSTSKDSAIPGLAREDAYASIVALPPLPEQRAIAAFLDRETAKLDALVAQKERLTVLLQEKRAALISHAVTKGLDPAAPLRDSGVPWLGQVPVHWELQELRRLVRRGTTITYGIVQAGPDVEDGIPYIRTSDMAGEYLPQDGYLRTSPEIDQAYRRSKVNTGDIVVAIRATVGKALPVPEYLEGANLTQGTAKVAPGDKINGTFLLWALNSINSQQRFSALGKGATFREITLDMLRRFVIPLPPLPEQQAIAASLDHKTARIDHLISVIRAGIQKLQEERAALIAAAVTGKIDVREAEDGEV